MENRLTAVREGGALLMAATYDGDGNRTFQLNRQVIPFSIERSEQDDSQDSETGDSVGGIEDSETTSNPQNDSSSLPETTGVKQDEVYTYYEKVYADPADSIFWYGFGQGTLQFLANINTSLGAYLSDWLCQAWDAITSEYELVLHSDAVYSEEDIEVMKNAGLSEEEIVEITGCEVDKNGEFMLECDKSKSQEALNASSDKKEASKPKDEVIVIPSKPDEVTRIDYDLTYYVNDINTANTQVLMTYGRNQTEKAVYVYGEERIAEDDLQTEETSEYLYDGRGSVVQTTIEAEIDMSLTYDPFGEITSGADENFVGYAYNGEESNEVTGLQYLRARYYDTELGSFITIDTYLGSLDNVISQNRYTYANNDPVNNIDPSGHYSVNVNGTSQYYQTTGLNELRDYMTAAALWAGQVTAQSSFNGSVARASNTSFMNYQSITGISQSTANSYINKGIAQAGQVSMNYGCSVPTVPNQAVAKFSNNVNAAKNSANARISSIKAQKKVQYDEYQLSLVNESLVISKESINPENVLNEQATIMAKLEKDYKEGKVDRRTYKSIKGYLSKFNLNSNLTYVVREALLQKLTDEAAQELVDSGTKWLYSNFPTLFMDRSLAAVTTSNTIVTFTEVPSAFTSAVRGGVKYGVPIVSTVIDFGIQVSSGENVVDAGVKAVSHTVIGIGAAKVGATVGSFIGGLPGIVIGGAVGFGLGVLGSIVFDATYDYFVKR